MWIFRNKKEKQRIKDFSELIFEEYLLSENEIEIIEKYDQMSILFKTQRWIKRYRCELINKIWIHKSNKKHREELDKFFVKIESTYRIFVLELNNGIFFVAETTNFKDDFIELFNDCQFIINNPVKRIVEILENSKLEDITFKYMREYGIKNVKSVDYFDLDDEKIAELNFKLFGKCLICGEGDHRDSNCTRKEKTIYKMINEGYSIDEISRLKNLTLNEIDDEIYKIINSGLFIDISNIFPNEIRQHLFNLIPTFNTLNPTEISKECKKLNIDVRHGQIRMSLKLDFCHES